MAKFIGNGTGQTIEVTVEGNPTVDGWRITPRTSGTFLADFLCEQRVSDAFLDALADRLVHRCRACNGRGWFGDDPFDPRSHDCKDCDGYGEKLQ